MGKLSISREKDYSEWYNTIVKEADLAEHSAVRGCMVIKPSGYAIWEKMHEILDIMFKETGHSNAYFPLFIPKSHFNREAAHVNGFAKECAVVTHYRLRGNGKGGVEVDPDAKLEEELIVRPTSETIIWSTYRNWIQSYRDLPILINQWANVVRWEMRTRLFLRTAEFLWQEGHTAHATSQEAEEEAMRMLEVYADFSEKYLAIPVIRGKKSPSERFAGALETYCIEALMQDGKSLQMGTSHFLGQNFAKAFDVKFQNQEGKIEYVWATSWGVSTRLMGAVIMAHSDDEGLVLPPKIAPVQVIIVPVYKTQEEYETVVKQAEVIRLEILERGISAKLDAGQKNTPGWKFAEYELKGIPIRMVLGPRDYENGTVEIYRRDTKEKIVYSRMGISYAVKYLLEEIQSNLFKRARQFQKASTCTVASYEEFSGIMEQKGGFVWAYWDGTPETEAKIKEETKATIRCIPLSEEPHTDGRCMVTGKPSAQKVLFAKAY